MQATMLTEEQLANILNISPRTLQMQRQNGRGIPFVKIGKSVRYDVNTVQDFIQRNNCTSTSIPQFKHGGLSRSETLEKISPD